MEPVSKIMESEYEIMKVLWENSPLTAIQIYNEVLKTKDCSKSTIITLTNRLVEKGAIVSKKDGLIFYEPLVTKKQYKDYHAKSFLKKIFNNDSKDLLSYFCNSKDITLDDIENLKEIILSKKGQ